MPGPMGGGGRVGRGYLTEEEKKNAPKITPELLKRVFSYLKPYWKQMLLVICAIFVSSTFSLLPSVLTGRIIDEGLIGQNMGALIRLILLSLGVTLAANLIGVLESYLNTWIAQHITCDMRNKMFAHLQKMSQSFFTANNQGDIITTINGKMIKSLRLLEEELYRHKVGDSLTVTILRPGPEDYVEITCEVVLDALEAE